MKHNSPEDTLWLSKESNEFLNEAIIWPNAMVKIFNLFGFVCVALLSYGVISADHLLTLACLIVLGCIAYKLYTYYQDITLINNELNRRAREK